MVLQRGLRVPRTIYGYVKGRELWGRWITQDEQKDAASTLEMIVRLVRALAVGNSVKSIQDS
jgi:hypothetical protein